MHDSILIPQAFATRTIDREGPDGQAWIEGLPGHVAHLLDDWNLTLRGEAMSGNVGLVWEVDRQDGTRAVLKVGWQDVWSRDEGAALSEWRGIGAVALLDRDTRTGSMLLERLDPINSLLSAPLAEAVEAAAEIARKLHVEPAHSFVGVLDQDDADSRSSGKYEAALRALRPEVENAISATTGVLLHGDFHYENILRAETEWKAIDPKPAVGPIEWEYIPLLRNRFDEFDTSDLLADIRRRLDRLLDIGGGDRRSAYMYARYRALLDADYAFRTRDDGYERVSAAIAEATDYRESK